jgi:hypothetical protein
MAEDSLTPEQERAMLALFEQASLNDYPNPERIGCPGTDFLKQLAHDHRSIKPSDHRLDHVAHCSPCFREFVVFRDKFKSQTTTRRAVLTGLGSLAAVLAVIAIAVRRPHRELTVNSESRLIDIDLRPFSPSRGTDSATLPTPRQIDLPRTRLDLRITLPFASQEGDYEVQILRADGTATGLTASGTARLRDGDTRFEVKLDLSHLPAAHYQLGVRRIPFDWLPVPVDVH